MAMLEVSMSDLEDTVDSVKDSMMAIETENDEIQQRLTVLEEAVIGKVVDALECACFPEIWTFFMGTQRNWEFRPHKK